MNNEGSGLHHLTLRVRDLKRSRGIHEDGLGLEVEVLPDRLRIGAGELGLFFAEPLEPTALSDR